MNWGAVIALLIDILGTILSSVAYVAMKLGQMKVESAGLNKTESKQAYMTCEWFSGFLLLMIGNVVHIVVLPFVDLVILSTGAALAICCSVILAVFYLEEKFFCRYDLPAMTCLLGGSLMIILLSDYSKVNYTADMVKDLIWSTSFATFMILYASVGVIAFCVYQ